MAISPKLIQKMAFESQTKKKICVKNMCMRKREINIHPISNWTYTKFFRNSLTKKFMTLSSSFVSSSYSALLHFYPTHHSQNGI